MGDQSVSRSVLVKPLRIFFASDAPHQAICHYRMRLQAGALQARGHECFVGTSVMVGAREVVGVLGDNSIVRGVDVVVAQPGVGVDWMDVALGCRRFGQAFVVDLDDWYWDLPESNVAGHDAGFGAWRDRLQLTICESHLVTVSTEFLVEAVSNWPGSPPVCLLRNPLDLGRWGNPENVTDGPVLGYAGVLYGHQEDVALLRSWLGPFVERHDLRIIHAGHHPSLPSFAESAGVDPERVETRPAHTWDEYAASHPMAGMDIGLVPLVDRSYNRAKSALKGMEYASCGVPFVASSSPEYQWLGCGALVGGDFADQGADAWVSALEPLLVAETLSRLARAQTERVRLESIELRWAEWESAYVAAAAEAKAG
jgi:hypothetical protein